MLYTAQKQDSIVQEYIFAETTMFVDNVRTSGRITAKIYSNFLRKLDESQLLYEIELEHSHKVVNPVYEINSTIKDYQINYYSFYQSDILKELYEGSGTYKMSEGDMISIIVKNKTDTLATKLKAILFLNESANEIYVSYGGMIRNEDY